MWWTSSVLVKKFVILYISILLQPDSTESSISTVLSSVPHSGGILNSHQILNFAFPHIWSFTDQALFLCDYIYIKPWNLLSLFYQDLACSASDLSFLQQSLPCGLQVVIVGIATIYGGDSWQKMYALFDFLPSQHLVLIFPILASAILSIIYHLLKRIGLFGGDV